MPQAAFPAVLRPGGASVRTLRSVAVGLVCTATAALGHLGAGGVMPVQATVAVFGGVTAVAWLLSARRVTPGQMIGMLLLCQACVHLGGEMADMTMSFAMLGAHVTATVVSAVILTRGEAFAWEVAERLALRATPHDLQVAAVPSWRPLVRSAATRSLHDIRLAHSRVERGPPVGA